MKTERSPALVVGVIFALVVAGLLCAGAAHELFGRSAPAPAPSSTDLAVTSTTPTTPPPTPDEGDASSDGFTQALADLSRDDYFHRAFVATGPDDVTVWKDATSTIRTGAGLALCDRCLGTDFVVTRDAVAWVELLETDIPGFDSTIRTISTRLPWRRPDGGSSLSSGDRACALKHGSSIATDGTDVYVAEGEDDATGSGYGQTVARCDLAKRTKRPLAKTSAAIRSMVFASGELFVVWSPTVAPAWRVQAISTKNGAIRNVVTLPFPLPEQTASSTDLYFVYRDERADSSRGHLASVPLAGGAITSIYDTVPNELLGHFAADESGLYVVRFVRRWTLTRFTKGAPPKDLAQLDAMPRAIALRKTDVVLAFLDELKSVEK